MYIDRGFHDNQLIWGFSKIFLYSDMEYDLFQFCVSFKFSEIDFAC